MVITAADIFSAAEKHRHVGVAYENALKAMVNLSIEIGCASKPGFFAKLRLVRRDNYARIGRESLLAAYNEAMHRVPDSSDDKVIASILADRAIVVFRSLSDDEDAQLSPDGRGYDKKREEQMALAVKKYAYADPHC